MEETVKNLLTSLEIKNGVSDQQIVNLEKQLNLKLPTQYKEFLTFSNGAEGYLGNSFYISIWSAEEIIPLNDGYEIDEFAPGLLLFATDGGDTGYAFDRRYLEMPIVEVPLVGLDLDEAVKISDSFNDFLHLLILKNDIIK